MNKSNTESPPSPLEIGKSPPVKNVIDLTGSDVNVHVSDEDEDKHKRPTIKKQTLIQSFFGLKKKPALQKSDSTYSASAPSFLVPIATASSKSSKNKRPRDVVAASLASAPTLVAPTYDASNEDDRKLPAKPPAKKKPKVPLRLAIEKALEENPDWKHIQLRNDVGKAFRQEVRHNLLKITRQSDETLDGEFGEVESDKFKKKAHQMAARCRNIVNHKQAETKRKRNDPNAVVAKGDGHAMYSQDREWTLTHQKSADLDEETKAKRNEANKAWQANYKEKNGVSYAQVWQANYEEQNGVSYAQVWQANYEEQNGEAYEKRRSENRRQNEPGYHEYQRQWRQGEVGTPGAALAYQQRLKDKRKAKCEEFRLSGLVGKTIGGLTITQDNCCTKTVAKVYIKLPREELGGKSILEVAESGKQAVYIGTSHAATERNVIREYLRFLVDTHERNVAVIQKDMNYKRTSAAAAAATTNNNNPRVIPYGACENHNLRSLTAAECKKLGIFTIKIEDFHFQSMEQGLKFEQMLQYLLDHLPFGTGKMHRKVGAGVSHSTFRNVPGNMVIFATILPPNFFQDNPQMVVVGESGK